MNHSECCRNIPRSGRPYIPDRIYETIPDIKKIPPKSKKTRKRELVYECTVQKNSKLILVVGVLCLLVAVYSFKKT